MIDTVAAAVPGLIAAIMRLRAKNTAPGPDGVPVRALVHALKVLEPPLRRLISAWLEQGQFPTLLERIIADRLVSH